MDKWIDVKEKPPGYGNHIIAYYNPSDANKNLYVVTAWRGRDGWYWDGAEKERADDDTLTVTHWQPLPAPPKPKGGKE